MDANTLAPQIRKAVRAATKTEGDALFGLTVSVKQPRGSMVTGVDLSVHIDQAEVRNPEDENGYTTWTARGRAIVARAYELAAPALAEADGRHSFCDVTVAGVSAPAPGDLPTDAEPELCDSCYEVLGACDCASDDTAGRPLCPNGHGPMAGRAEIHTGGENFGTWHTCVTPACGASYIAPSAALVRSLATDTVHVTPQIPAAEPVSYGTSRGGYLAAVR